MRRALLLICLALPACGGVASSSEGLVASVKPCTNDAGCMAGWECRAGLCALPSASLNAPSCQSTGPCGDGSDSCCSSPVVTGGAFYRTYENQGKGPYGERDPAVVGSFRLDKYEVTVGRFRSFVAAMQAGWLPPGNAGKHTHLNHGAGLSARHSFENGWSAQASDLQYAYIDPWQDHDVASYLGCGPHATWTSAAGANENLPINCVTWFDAYAFCIWDGGFLPSEAEWEYAAAGGSEERMYPWGATPPGASGQYAIHAGSSIAPVGKAKAGAGKWGHFDLAGNVWEWTLDYYNQEYMQPPGGDGTQPCVDCLDDSNDNYDTWVDDLHVVRGGDFSSANGANPVPYFLAPWHRSAHGNRGYAGRSDRVGVRCARSP